MPKFLENALRHEGRKKGLTGKHLEHYVYGGMNNIGAMHGSKETAKGAEMEKKHMAKEKKAPFHMTHITHHDDGSHTVEHEHHRKPASKSGAFMERPEPESYSVGSGKELMSKLHEHLGIGAAKAPKSEEKELEAAEHEPPHESEEEEEQVAEGV
jgi:hypothetical protein